MSVEIKQLSGSFVSPKDDAVLHRIFHGGHGVVRGCELTYPGGNQTKVAAGYAYIHGRMLEISEESITCTLPSSTTAGEVILKIDMEATTPAYLLARTPQETLTQEDINNSGTVYEMQLGTFTASSSALSDPAATYTTLSSAITQNEVGNIFSEDVSYAAGSYCSYENELYKFTVAHPAGAWLGTDVEKIAILDELAACTALQSDVDLLKTKTVYYIPDRTVSAYANTFLTNEEECGVCKYYTSEETFEYHTIHRIHIYGGRLTISGSRNLVTINTGCLLTNIFATRTGSADLDSSTSILNLSASIRYNPKTGVILLYRGADSAATWYNLNVSVEYIDPNEDPVEV